MSSRLLIISPILPAPGWILRLAERLRLSGIATDVTSEINAVQIQGAPLVLNLSSATLQNGKTVLTLGITHTGSKFQKGLSLLELFAFDGKNRSLIYRSQLHTFRNEEEGELHSIYFLEKGIKMQLEGLSFKAYKALSANAKPNAVSGILKKISRFLQRDQWICSVIDAPIPEVALSNGSLSATALVESNTNLLMADPFGVIYKGQEYILFERQETDKKGEIACCNDGKVTIALRNEFHLSYPFLLEHAGEVYCIPEQHESGRLDLYNFNPESRTLSFKKTLLHNFAATDPTLVRYNNKFWLFCTDTSDNGANSRLHIYHADHLEGDWQPHRLNPVKISVRGSRPGGTFFEHEGRLYRPGQNSAETYGGSLIIYRIDLLTDSEYQETEVNEIFPANFGHGFAGIHTISSLGNRTLIDLKQKVFSFRNILHYLRKT